MLTLPAIIDLLNKQDKMERDPVYFKWRQVYYGMSIHIDGILPAHRDLRYGTITDTTPFVFANYYEDWQFYQQIFETQLFSRYPKEREEMRQWRLSQYKAFTKDPFLKAIDTITGAIFQESGYSIKVDNPDDEQYIWGNNFEDKSLPEYFAKKFQNICADPNGIFVVIPKEPGYATTTQKVEPKVYFIPSRFIIKVTKEEIIFSLDDIVWTINEIGYFRFAKQGSQYYHIDEQYGGYYAHMMRKVPYMKAGGKWNMQGYYDSWLDAAKAIADEFVGSMSDEQLVMKDASFPYTIEASTDCPDCDGGTVQLCTSCRHQHCDCDADHTNGANYALTKCPSCGGTGDISRNPGDRLVAPYEEMDKDLIKIVSPETTINKLHIDRNKELYNSILRALHMNYIEEAQSGVAKDKDMETRYQFILKISNDLFDRLIKKTIEAILSLRNVSSVNGMMQPIPGNFTIVKPVQFNIYTSYDLLNEYKEAFASNLPGYQMSAILDDFTDKRFGGDDVLLKKTWFITQSDILAVNSAEQIQIILLNGAATQRDYQYHLQLPKILAQIVRERSPEWFIKANYEQIDNEVQTLFNAMVPPIPVIRPTETIDETRVNV